MESQGAVVVRAGDRFVSRSAGVLSRHCFSFGPHYDPANTRFGPLVGVNEELVDPGVGFADHPHSGVDIVTWVAEGQLEHTDSAGHTALCEPGVVQVLRAGSGISHSERNAGPGPLRFIQFWLAGEDPGAPPAYEHRDLRTGLGSGALVPIAFGGEESERLNRPDAVVYAGRLRPREAAQLPSQGWLHLFVVRGAVAVPGLGALLAGDSARLTSDHGVVISAQTDGAEVVVCEMSPARP